MELCTKSPSRLIWVQAKLLIGSLCLMISYSSAWFLASPGCFELAIQKDCCCKSVEWLIFFYCSDCKFLNWFWMPTRLNNLKDKFLVVVKFCWSVLGSEWLQVVEPLGLFCVWINISSFSMKPNMIIYNLIFWHGLKMEQSHEVYLLFWSNSQFSCRTLFSYEKIKKKNCMGIQ